MINRFKPLYKLKPLDIEYLKEKAANTAKTKSDRIPGTIKRARKILKILNRDNFQCVKCKSKINLTIDHINGREFAKWDNHQKYKFDECQILCIPCHKEKNEISWDKELK